jgi:plastocyanin
MRVLRSFVILAMVVLLVGACSDDRSDKAAATTTTAAAALSGPQTYTVIVDGPSTLNTENYVYGTYFPGSIKVRPGDSITYDNRSSNDIHTVTFGVKDDRSDQPPTVLKSRQANPVVFGPCYTTQPARPDITCPPPTAGAPEYTGKGYWNSGVIMPIPLPPEAGPKTTTVKLAADIAPGQYALACLLHPNMKATVSVVGSDAERQSPAEVAAAADKELGEVKAQGTSIPTPTAATMANGAAVASGWGDKIVAVNRFDPETVTIKAGQTVTWRTHSDWMPHTVSFQAPFKSPAEPNALKPSGVKTGGKFAGGESHSGIFGPPPDGLTDTFTLTFTKSGKYPYLCLLHPGMAGTVEVS